MPKPARWHDSKFSDSFSYRVSFNCSRLFRAFFAFRIHFPGQADTLFRELDLAKQRQLEESMSRSTSQSSLKSGGQLSVSRTANPRTTPKTPNTDPLGYVPGCTTSFLVSVSVFEYLCSIRQFPG